MEGPFTPTRVLISTNLDDPKSFDERQATLQKIVPKLKSVLVYKYDFGDSWDHFITVEKILSAYPAVASAAECLDGAGACPPEDCGGVSGYADLLKILTPPTRKVRELIAVARAIRNATGPGRSVAEQKIMDTLKGIAGTCCSVLEQAGVPRIPDLAAADALIPDLRRSMLVVAEPRDNALECLRFNARPRDAFAGARRGPIAIN